MALLRYLGKLGVGLCGLLVALLLIDTVRASRHMHWISFAAITAYNTLVLFVLTSMLGSAIQILSSASHKSGAHPRSSSEKVER